MVKCQQSLIGVKECWCSQWLTRSWVNWRAPTLPPEQRQREGRDETGNLLVGVLCFHSSNSSLWLLTKPCVFLCSTNTRLGRIFMWFPWILMTVTEAGTMGRLRKKGSLVLMAKNVPLSGPITPAPIYHPATAGRDGPAADVPSLPPSLPCRPRSVQLVSRLGESFFFGGVAWLPEVTTGRHRTIWDPEGAGKEQHRASNSDSNSILGRSLSRCQTFDMEACGGQRSRAVASFNDNHLEFYQRWTQRPPSTRDVVILARLQAICLHVTILPSIFTFFLFLYSKPFFNLMK